MNRRDAIRVTAVAGVGAALGASLLREMLTLGSLHRVSQTRTQMGTLVRITVMHPERREARALLAGAFKEMDRLESVFSRYRRGTPVWQLNQAGVINHPPPELRHVINYSLDVAHETGGALDVTVAPVLDLYRASAERGVDPDPEMLFAAQQLVGFRRLSVNPDRIAFADQGMSLTLDGIAKGYIVDRTVRYLAERGGGRMLVDAGGDIGVANDANDPWRISIQDPHDPSAHAGIIHLSRGACASSGDYMQAFRADRAAHHIIDPRTGHSPTELSGVSVVADTLMEADAVSTAIMVLGVNAGVALAERRNTGAFLVTKNGRRITSGRWPGQSPSTLPA